MRQYIDAVITTEVLLHCRRANTTTPASRQPVRDNTLAIAGPASIVDAGVGRRATLASSAGGAVIGPSSSLRLTRRQERHDAGCRRRQAESSFAAYHAFFNSGGGWRLFAQAIPLVPILPLPAVYRSCRPSHARRMPLAFMAVGIAGFSAFSTPTARFSRRGHFRRYMFSFIAFSSIIAPLAQFAPPVDAERLSGHDGERKPIFRQPPHTWPLFLMYGRADISRNKATHASRAELLHAWAGRDARRRASIAIARRALIIAIHGARTEARAISSPRRPITLRLAPTFSRRADRPSLLAIPRSIRVAHWAMITRGHALLQVTAHFISRFCYAGPC